MGLKDKVDTLIGRKKESPYTITHMPETEERKARYYLFKTKDVTEYLKFLEKFDEAKYQIVNISTSMNVSALSSNQEFYMVTYKRII